MKKVFEKKITSKDNFIITTETKSIKIKLISFQQNHITSKAFEIINGNFLDV